jgi:meso-butanediol dehydrogenase/(S,S)-butanediol dehydrogenase/diacetyl reductase
MNILITGGTSGIGKGVAQYFAGQNNTVTIVGTRSDGKDIATEIGKNVTYVKTDITQQSQVQELFMKLSNAGLDVLINSAGIYIGNDDRGILSVDPQNFEHEWRVNSFGTFLMCKYAMPLLQKVKGNIVNISSLSGLIAEPFALGYGSSKAAVDSLTKSLALAHAKDGVRVNAVCPGPIDTPMLHASFGGQLEGNPEYEDWIKDMPMRRYGNVEDIVKAVAYLADPANTFVTGALLSVDGGWAAKAL